MDEELPGEAPEVRILLSFWCKTARRRVRIKKGRPAFGPPLGSSGLVVS